MNKTRQVISLNQKQINNKTPTFFFYSGQIGHNIRTGKSEQGFSQRTTSFFLLNTILENPSLEAVR